MFIIGFIVFVLLLLYVYYCFAFVRYYKGKSSSHFNGIRFFDPESDFKKSFWDVLKWRFTRKPSPWPDTVANDVFDLPPKRVMGSALRISCVGHVTFLIQTEGLNILTDPVWSERVSPFGFIGPKRVIAPGIKFEDLPPIDIIWVSHNHYDHLDLVTLDKLWKEHKPRIMVPLGNETIIKKYNSKIAVETFDWEEKVTVDDKVTLYFEPMQHWSARGILDRNKALWAALNIQAPAGNIYFIGDSGYGEGRYFKKAKEKFGQFRVALLPMGAYEPRWFMKYAHMNPEDMLKAHIDLGEPLTIPSHYDVFRLTDESWGSSLTDLEKAKEKLGVGRNIKIVKPGQFFLNI